MKRLFIYFAGVGDLVFFIPLFRKLAESGSLDLLTRTYGKPLFSDQSYISKVHTLKHPNRGRNYITRLIFGGPRRVLGAELADCGYDEIIVLRQERKVITEWTHGWRGVAQMRVMNYPDGDPERLMKGFESLGLRNEDREPYPRFDLPESSLEKARSRISSLGKRVIGVQVGSGPVNKAFMRGKNLKGLSFVRWAELITDILDDGGADAFIFHGTALESGDVHSVMGLVPVKYRCYLHDWTGQVGLVELKAVLAESYAFLSVDTGPAHMAAASGCPMLVFFGPSDPKVYPMRGKGHVEVVIGSAPCQFCMGTDAYKQCGDNKCMQSLGRDALFAGWQRLEREIKALSPS